MMNRQFSSALDQVATRLVLADGNRWSIIAGDEQASVIVSRIVTAMKLSPIVTPLVPVMTGGDESWFLDFSRQFLILVDREKSVLSIQLFENDDVVTCVFGPADVDLLLAVQIMQLSQVIIAYTEARGGMLLHGALAERDGNGVILAGPGGRGKTTASKRLVSPWRSLCDDTTLVVCDKSGRYWAHPWPTWSLFFFDGAGGTWDVQNAVPLKGIFFLDQAQKEQIEPLGTGQAACLLTESSEQASCVRSHYMKKDELRKHRQMRFDSICALTKAVPSHVLYLDRYSAFWEEIERVLND